MSQGVQEGWLEVLVCWPGFWATENRGFCTAALQRMALWHAAGQPGHSCRVTGCKPSSHACLSSLANLWTLCLKVGVLVAKTLSNASANPFIASAANVYNPVLALDVFLVQVGCWDLWHGCVWPRPG